MPVTESAAPSEHLLNTTPRAFTQREVEAAAAEELSGRGAGGGAASPPPMASSPSAAAALSGAGGAGDGVKGYNTPPAPEDLEALVDELRADIAASRAVLQQLRASGAGGVGAGAAAGAASGGAGR